MSDNREYSYFGFFHPEEPLELVSIIRTDESGYFERWNETLGIWRFLLNDSIGETHIQMHDTRLEASWVKAVFPQAFE